MPKLNCPEHLLISLCFIVLFNSSGFSQAPAKDGSDGGDAIKQSVLLYDRFTGAQASIYNGGDYQPFIFEKDGIPFFESDTLAGGWVGYEGRMYEPMHIQYDLVRDQVLILNYDRKAKIVLHNELVDSFQFLNHKFLKLNENSLQNLRTTGFYDLLYNGNTIKTFANRKKSIKEVISDNTLIRVFSKWDRFYIFKHDKYYLVTNKKDVFRLLNDRKSEIKAGMRRQRIKFRRTNFEEALLAASKIYDQR